MNSDPKPATVTNRKKPAMNSPFATQTQTEARIASRLADPAKIRRALRLDNPFMFGADPAEIVRAAERDLIPTPTFE